MTVVVHLRNTLEAIAVVVSSNSCALHAHLVEMVVPAYEGIHLSLWKKISMIPFVRPHFEGGKDDIKTRTVLNFHFSLVYQKTPALFASV